MRDPLRFVLVLLAGAAGCIRVDVPDVRLDGGLPDSTSFVDTDGDGLCDTTEASSGTNPDDADSDDDGLSDFVEADLAFDALSKTQPPADWVGELAATEGAKATIVATLEVTGQGEDFTAFVTPLVTASASGIDPRDLVVGVNALSADPPGNVTVIDSEMPRFRGVVGKTVLVTEVAFEQGNGATRDCIEAVPFQVGIKQTDGGSVAQVTRLLLVMPAGKTRLETAWCRASDVCR